MLQHRVICDTSAEPQGTTHLLWVRVACSRWGHISSEPCFSQLCYMSAGHPGFKGKPVLFVG